MLPLDLKLIDDHYASKSVLSSTDYGN